jgi:hypothetical protein
MKGALLALVALAGYLIFRRIDASENLWSPDSPSVPVTGGYYTPVLPTEGHYTTLPLVPSEPDVSQGLPLLGNPLIPVCPDMITSARFPGDTQLVCQCPTGQIQGGNPASMLELMEGTDPADFAWRRAFCGVV